MVGLITNAGLEPEKLEKVSKAFAEVRSYYEMAEQKMKLIEGIGDGLYIPSVNELRYAGCHLSRATVEIDVEVALEELDKALRHCKRAVYDALEVGITYYLETLRTFIDDYRHVVITSIIPDLAEGKIRISAIRDFITKPRDQERDEFWEGCTEHFLEIQQISTKFENSREELNKLALQQELERERFKQEQDLARKRHTHNTVLAYAGVIAAIVFGLFTIFPASSAPKAAITGTESSRQAE